MHVFASLGIQASRRIQPMSLMTKQSCTKKRVGSKISGSPGSHQFRFILIMFATWLIFFAYVMVVLPLILTGL